MAMPMKATPTVPIVPHDVPVARAVRLQTKQAVTRKNLGHPRADEDPDAEHDQDGRHGLVDAVDDPFLHVLPAEAEGEAEDSRQERRRDEQDLRTDLVHAVPDAEE
jgi:hypothetical protein